MSIPRKAFRIAVWKWTLRARLVVPIAGLLVALFPHSVAEDPAEPDR